VCHAFEVVGQKHHERRRIVEQGLRIAAVAAERARLSAGELVELSSLLASAMTLLRSLPIGSALSTQARLS
jgi:hypothetical protein